MAQVTAEPGPTVEQRIAELEAAAHIADQQNDYLFARELRAKAEMLSQKLSDER